MRKPVFNDPATWGMRKPRDWCRSESWVDFCQRSYLVIFQHKQEQHRLTVEMNRQEAETNAEIAAGHYAPEDLSWFAEGELKSITLHCCCKFCQETRVSADDG